jgi:hypothetical protein
VICICARPWAITSAADPWINPNCEAHGRHSVGNIWRQQEELSPLWFAVILGVLAIMAYFVLGLLL